MGKKSRGATKSTKSRIEKYDPSIKILNPSKEEEEDLQFCYLYSTDGQHTAVYYVPPPHSFSVQDLMQYAQVAKFDYQNNTAILDSVDIMQCIQQLETSHTEKNPMIRIYMRTNHNQTSFAKFQHTLELNKVYRQTEELEGFIAHIGYTFLFGDSQMNLKEAAHEVYIWCNLYNLRLKAAIIIQRKYKNRYDSSES
jgi:hypothetical protein